MPASVPGPDVSAAFAGLARALASDGDVGPYLRAVCEHCVRLAGTDTAAIVYAAGAGEVLTSVAASDERAHALAEASIEADASPWLECASTGQLIAIADLRTREQRWPWLTAMAAGTGLTAATFIPIGQLPNAKGALALLSGAEPDVAEILVALSLADAAAAGLAISAVLRQQRAAIAQLQSALSSRIMIEQAKGVLAERWQMAPDDAFDALRRHARASQRPLADLAAAVVAGTAQLARPEPGSGEPVSRPCQP